MTVQLDASPMASPSGRSGAQGPRPEHPTVSVVIPARNEAANLPALLARMPAVHEVILVDGDSVDDTIAVAQAHYPEIKVMFQPAPGKGAALAAGFAAARGDILVGIDADCSMDPQEIHAFVGALRAGADLAKGSRYVAGGGSSDLSRLRSLGNRMLTQLSNRLYRQEWSELCYGYFAFWSEILPALNVAPTAHRDLTPTAPKKARGIAYGDGFEIEAMLFTRAAGAGLRVVEVASMEYERANGVSNLNTWRDGARVLRTLLTETSTRPVGQPAKPAAAFPSDGPRAAPVVIPAPRSADREHTLIQAANA